MFRDKFKDVAYFEKGIKQLIEFVEEDIQTIKNKEVKKERIYAHETTRY